MLNQKKQHTYTPIPGEPRANVKYGLLPHVCIPCNTLQIIRVGDLARPSAPLCGGCGEPLTETAETRAHQAAHTSALLRLGDTKSEKAKRRVRCRACGTTLTDAHALGDHLTYSQHENCLREYRAEKYYTQIGDYCILTNTLYIPDKRVFLGDGGYWDLLAATTKGIWVSLKQDRSKAECERVISKNTHSHNT